MSFRNGRKGEAGASFALVSNQDSEAAKFYTGSKSVFVGHIVAQKYRTGAGERAFLHEGLHGRTFVSALVDQFHHALPGLDRELVLLRKALRKGQSRLTFLRILARMKRAAMRLRFVPKVVLLRELIQLFDHDLREAMWQVAQCRTVCQFSRRSVRSRFRHSKAITKMPGQILQRASADKREPSTETSRQSLKPTDQIIRNRNAVWCLSNLHQRTVKIQKQRNRASRAKFGKRWRSVERFGTGHGQKV